MLDRPTTGADAAVRFLQWLRPDGPWTLTANVPDHGAWPTRTFSDISAARAWVTEQAAAGRNVYYQSARMVDGLNHRASKADVVTPEFAHIDIDKDDKGQRLTAETKAALVERLRACTDPGPASMIVDSGGGVQALWRVDAPDSGGEAVEMVERANRHLIAQFGGDVGTHNADRLLRLPGLINFPNAKKRAAGRIAVPARLIESTGRAYIDFEFSLAPPQAERKAVDLVIGAPEPVDDLSALAEEHGLPDWLIRIIEHGHDPDKPDAHRSRSEWLFACVCALVRHRVPDEEILGLLLDAQYDVSDSVHSQTGRTPEDYAERQIVRAHGVVGAEPDPERDFDDAPEPEVPASLSGSEVEGGAGSTTAEKPIRRRGKARSLAELIDLPDPEFLVEGLIPETGTGTLYGEPYGGKTFCSLDLSLRIALGMSYVSAKVKRGRVIYIAGEGSPARIRDRVLAWCAGNGVDPRDLDGWWWLDDTAVILNDPASVAEWLKVNRDPDGTLRRALVVFDTQARNMTGDENSAKDVSQMIAGIDTIRGVTGGFALRLHHEGRVAKQGGRGSTAGMGADDVTLHLTVQEKAKRVALEVEAMRDGEPGRQMVFEMVPQQFDVGGRKRLSVFVRVVASGTVERLLVRLYEERPVEVKGLFGDEEGFSKANTYKLLDQAREQGWVEPKPGWGLTKDGLVIARQLGARDPAVVEFEGVDGGNGRATGAVAGASEL